MTAVASRRNTSIVICHDGDFEYLQDYQNNSECDPILNNSRIKRLILIIAGQRMRPVFGR